jgi:hypothetical protein
MHSRSSADLGYRLLGLLPAGAAATAEGAWVAVVYAAMHSGSASGPGGIGLWMFVVAAILGLVTARRVHGRASRSAKLAVTLLLGLVGMVSGAALPVQLGRSDSGAAVILFGGGWLLGLAAWRGTRHADPMRDDAVTASLLVWATPALAIPWLIGTATDAKAEFILLALPATLLFVASALLAVSVTRLDTLGRPVGLDWRRNRTWLALLGTIVAALIAIGTPMAFTRPPRGADRC